MPLLMVNGLLNLVRIRSISHLWAHANTYIEHTMLVTETGVEVLTARNENSPGGPVLMPTTMNGMVEAGGAFN